MQVPVIDQNRQPLMPTSPARAAQWIKSKKATPFWNLGIFCVRLNQPTGNIKQNISCGVDSGSKREAVCVKSKKHTYVNILADAVTWVKEAVEQKRNARRARRNRTTPCRKNKYNRTRGGLPPSTKARWNSKLRIINKLRKIYPINSYVVEDIAASTKKGKRWNVTFSPLQCGKEYFYMELEKLGKLTTKQGYETKEMRDKLGLKKSSSKMAEIFEAHNVDSWVLAHSEVGGDLDNKELTRIVPLRFHRRQLHMFQPSVGGLRRPYGGTMSLGFKRGSLVRHPKYDLCYVGGTLGDRVSLHNLKDGKRLCQNAKPSDIKFLAYNYFRCSSPTLKG
jgi:hypothetical protein